MCFRNMDIRSPKLFTNSIGLGNTFKIVLFTTTFLFVAHIGFGQDGEREDQEMPGSSYDFCFEDSTKLQYYSNYAIRTDSSFCSELYCEIFEWIGVKYAYGQGTKNGTDCSRFVMNVTKELLGYELDGGSASMFTQCEIVKRESLEEFDLVFFRIRGGRISHVGVYLQNGYFVHSSVQGGVMINHLDEAYYKKYFAGGGRVPDQMAN